VNRTWKAVHTCVHMNLCVCVCACFKIFFSFSFRSLGVQLADSTWKAVDMTCSHAPTNNDEALRILRSGGEVLSSIHTQTYTCMYKYTCVCVCVCVCERERGLVLYTYSGGEVLYTYSNIYMYI